MSRTRITADINSVIGDIDNRLYGSFIEHLGRAVYGGIYDPENRTADENGFRRDVLDAVKKLNVPLIRYPGGNFVSGYRWEDGVGDKSLRPKRMDLAWRSVETNQFGLDEFYKWSRLAGSEIMLAVNLGTRGAEDARNLVEYCNCDTDTYYSQMRKRNGFEKPFGIKLWCLGNEMDGDWQIGARSAEEYAKIAREAAKLMKLTDPTIETAACGSSSVNSPTFGDWERTVLREAYDEIDYISLHNYYGNPDNNTEKYLDSCLEMDKFIKTAASLCELEKRRRRSDKTVYLSFDEWNVWFHSGEQDKKIERWQVAPPLLEDIYNFEDALVAGTLLTTLQNNCDSVKVACLAQLVNVIAPIMTDKNGVRLQTIFYPFYYASAFGRGKTLKTLKDDNSSVESSVIFNGERSEIVVFAVNKSLKEDAQAEFEIKGFDSCEFICHEILQSDDLKSENIAPSEKKDVETIGSSALIPLEKHSWNMIRLRVK